MTGSIGILNVGCGDTKLVFDKGNPADCIRAARIVKDMLRRGYALMVEVEEKGKKIYRRVLEFKEDKFEYIIADFDPIVAQDADRRETHEQEQAQAEAPPAARAAETEAAPSKSRRRTKAISATRAKGVAIARTAGG
jgi:hypothetical protein